MGHATRLLARGSLARLSDAGGARQACDGFATPVRGFRDTVGTSPGVSPGETWRGEWRMIEGWCPSRRRLLDSAPDQISTAPRGPEQENYR